jgi:hypothetical protein
VARPTRSRGLYAQMVGRAARLYPGKTHATILDVVGSTREHQLVTLADLTGKAVKDGAGKRAAIGSTKGEDFQLAVPLDPMTVGGTAVDLFSGREFGWIPLGEAFVLPAGDGWVLLEPQPKDAERWWVIAQRGRGDTPELVEHSLDLGYAQGVAEDMVRRLGAAALARGGAEWRQRAASGGQMAQSTPEARRSRFAVIQFIYFTVNHDHKNLLCHVHWNGLHRKFTQSGCYCHCKRRACYTFYFGWRRSMCGRNRSNDHLYHLCGGYQLSTAIGNHCYWYSQGRDRKFVDLDQYHHRRHHV